MEFNWSSIGFQSQNKYQRKSARSAGHCLFFNSLRGNVPTQCRCAMPVTQCPADAMGIQWEFNVSSIFAAAAHVVFQFTLIFKGSLLGARSSLPIHEYCFSAKTHKSTRNSAYLPIFAAKFGQNQTWTINESKNA